MNLYKKYTAKPKSFSVIEAALVSDNHFPFRKNTLERIMKIIITIYNKIRPEKIEM